MFAFPGRSRPYRLVRPRDLGSPRRSIRAPVSEPDPATVWRRYRAELQRAVSDATWHIWLERLRLRSFDGTTLTLDAPDDARLWIRSRFGRLLTACAETTLGQGVQVEVGAPSSAEPKRAPAKRKEQEFNPRYTFE